MTAGDRNFIRGEVHRNERAPRWGVAKIEEAEQKMENNTVEMSIEQMEQVSVGKGPGWSLKDLWPKIKSWFVGDEDDD